MPELTVSQLARRMNINIATIRYYERRGLIEKPKRNASGYRLYTTDSITRISFIIKTKALGFTLKEISDMLTLENQSANACENNQHRISNKIQMINDKINLLKKIKISLNQLYEQCKSTKRNDYCSIINCFDIEGCKSC